MLKVLVVNGNVNVSLNVGIFIIHASCSYKSFISESFLALSELKWAFFAMEFLLLSDKYCYIRSKAVSSRQFMAGKHIIWLRWENQ